MHGNIWDLASHHRYSVDTQISYFLVCGSLHISRIIFANVNSENENTFGVGKNVNLGPSSQKTFMCSKPTIEILE